MSISHALAAAEAIRARLNTAEHAEHQATTPAEISEGRAARLKV